ncbi:MAG: hypothetical protein M3430_16620 [Acidobacteriota bacterium]|nr:hypothetical protein [Acidobacteriota bacterium]
MFSPRSSFTRILATLMPLCFAWVFVACISLCAPHGEEARGDTAYHSAASIDDSHGGEQCPVPSAPTYALTGRQSIVPAPQMIGDAAASFTPSLSLAGFALHLPARLLTPPSTSDPPLDRLRVLRI